MNKRTVRGFLVVVCFLPGLNAGGATITVDGHSCTLVDAIHKANGDAASAGSTCAAGSSGHDEIVLEHDLVLLEPHGTAVVYGGRTGLPEIKSSITIRSSVPHTKRVIERAPILGCSAGAHPFRIFHVGAAAGSALTLEDITIRNGCLDETDADVRGGAIFAQKNLTLTRCLFERNQARTKSTTNVLTRAVRGGAVAITGHELVVTDSTFTENRTFGETETHISHGGAIWSDRHVLITRSTFSKNVAEGVHSAWGGAINATWTDTESTITDTVFAENEVKGAGSAAGGGVGFYSGSLALTRVIFRKNKAIATGTPGNATGAGLWIDSDAAHELTAVTGCLFEDNQADGKGDAQGGGMCALVKIAGAIENTTFSRNIARGGSAAGSRARGGGLALMHGTGKTAAAIRNVTFADNKVEEGASRHGGALYVDKYTISQFRHVTMTGNAAIGSTEGGGLYIASGFVHADSLLATENVPNDCHAAAAGGYHSGGFNFIARHTNCTLGANDTQLPTGTKVTAPLAENGCVTKLPDNKCLPTVALLNVPLVIDKGGPGGLTDARGAARPHDYATVTNKHAGAEGGSDPGAFERADNERPHFTPATAPHVPYTEGGAAVKIAGSVTAVNGDGPSFTGGSLTVTLSGTGHVAAEHKLEIATEQTSSTHEIRHETNGNLTYGGHVIGHVTQTAHELKVTFSTSVTVVHEAVTALVRALRYSNHSTVPPASVQYKLELKDGQGTAFGGHDTSLEYPVTITITRRNHPPEFRNLEGRSRTCPEGKTELIAHADAAIVDPDEAAHHHGGSLHVTVVDHVAGEDTLSIANHGHGAGQIGFVAPHTSVHYGGVAIGTVHGRDTATLLVNLNDKATPAAVGALLRAITYRSGDAPRSVRTVKFTFKDGGGTAHGGRDEATASLTLHITAANDAPSFEKLSGHVEYHPHVDLTPVVLDADAELEDKELDRGHWGGAVLTVKRHPHADASDVFGFTAASHVATHTHSGGVLTIRFTEHATRVTAMEVLQSITYSRAHALEGDIALQYTLSDGNTGAQGSGGALSAPPASKTVKPRVRKAVQLHLKEHTPNPSKVGEELTVGVQLETTATPSHLKVEITDGHGADCVITLAPMSTPGHFHGTCRIRPRSTAVTHITATYAGTADHEAEVDAETHTVTHAATHVHLTAAAASHVDAPVEVAVHLATTPAVTAPATGPEVSHVEVTAHKGTGTAAVTKTCGTATVDAGVSRCELKGLDAGTWTIRAHYPQSAHFSAGETSREHVVGKRNSKTLITADVPDFSSIGQSVLVHVRVEHDPAHAGGPPPTGSVTISDGTGFSTPPCTAHLHNGIGNCTLTPSVAGERTFHASYAGDRAYHTSSATEAHDVRHTGAKQTTISLTAPSAATTYGDLVRASFSVTSPAGGTPTGEVTVQDHAGGYCTALVSAGSCQLKPAGGGTRSLFATYHGSSEHAPAISANVAHTVHAATTDLTFSSSPSPSTAGALVTVHVEATATPATAGPPTGTVTISSGSNSPTCIAPLNAAGRGSCQLVLTEAKTYTLKANYHATTDFTAKEKTESHTVNAAVTTPPPAGGRILGDVNGKDGITLEDARLALRAYLGLDTLTAVEACAADYDQKGGLTLEDAVKILTCYLKDVCSTGTCN